MKEYRNSSGLLAIEFSGIESDKYLEITKFVVDSLNLEESSELTVGLNEKFQDFKLGSSFVGLEWDIWSGYLVTAKDVKSEPLAKTIAALINEQES